MFDIPQEKTLAQQIAESENYKLVRGATGILYVFPASANLNDLTPANVDWDYRAVLIITKHGNIVKNRYGATTTV